MFSLRLFGGASLHGDSGPLTGTVAQRRRLAFLAILAVSHDRGVSRDKLIALLWPEADTESTRHFLADSLYTLRKALGKDAILTVGDHLRLNPAVVSADVAEFQDALERGDRERAVALHQGLFLDGFFVSDDQEFEPWAAGERARLAREYARTLEALAETREGEENFPAAAEWWRKLAAHDPYNSRTAVRLMLALDGAGDRGAALQHAQTHTRLLREEFGAAADPDVAKLAERLRSDPVARDEAPALLRVTAAAPNPVPNTDPVPANLAPPRRRGTRHAALAIAAIALLLAAAVLRGGWRERIGAARTEAAPIRSIVVLPLENLSGDPEQEYFADGMTDALITELARYDQLRVISRTSAMQYKGARKPLPEIARELGVDAVVEGTVMRDGPRIRITAQLIRASTDEHMWAQSYERDLRDILVLQNELAEAIAREIHGATSLSQSGQGQRVRRVDPLAHELYLKGRHAWNRRTEDGMEQAIRYFRAAIHRDSSFAPAYAGLADSYFLLPQYAGRTPKEFYPPAKRAALQALELDSTLAEAHTTLGGIAAFEWDWAAVEPHYQKAIEANPSYATAHQWYAEYFTFFGRLDEALAEARRARELDPLSPMVGVVLGWILATDRQYDAAHREFQRILELDPDFVPARENAIGVYIRQGRYEEALAENRRIEEITGRSRRVTIAYIHARQGNRSGARAILAELERSANAGRVPPEAIAAIHVALGDKDRAFELLDQAYRENSVSLTWMKINSAWDPLRSDPRFSELLRKIGVDDLPRRETDR